MYWIALTTFVLFLSTRVGGSALPALMVLASVPAWLVLLAAWRIGETWASAVVT